LLIDSKKGKIKEEIAKSMGRLSRISRKLYEERRGQMMLHPKKDKN
jgi:hypothetical protein